ncbi:hypothetical protein [Dysgonomonas sp. GY617]|uniref:hypothetical protein n=1 Tax=Dysgonomonas sp. GY617 TaxID=2780420 RepID=UPI0018833C80|nr:hypothetical protein [Dysgonomonas sp. GY617]MBF0575554.1 hypothetical protein [Dysgonomonas sp. GY617]
MGQVGINTTDPVATLDVLPTSTGPDGAEGVLLPRLTGSQLAVKNAQYGAAQHSALVYITASDPAASGKTARVTSAGYYFYDATADNGSGANSGLWLPLTGSREQFYLPSVVIPTDGSNLPDAVNYTYTSSTGLFTIDLFNLYLTQYGTPQATSSPSAALSVGASPTSFNYFVLYFDTSCFNNVSVSPSGVLSYSLVSGFSVSDRTFMNIMLREK